MQVGIIIPKLDNQLSYMICKHVNNSNDNIYTVFYEDISPYVIRPKCATMPINEIWSFNGILISTNLRNTLSSLKTINKSKLIFYIWELEFLKGKTNYIENINIYQNHLLKLVTRSEEYAKNVYNYCGIMPSVTENISEMVKLWT